ncbi:MAG: LysM peptidoglycan-binding domain-containing protein [Chloroflexi bacterium]|nr:LysM peptidoglycan-binding domain-containing protein [Chloroflexota bacterium]
MARLNKSLIVLFVALALAGVLLVLVKPPSPATAGGCGGAYEVRPGDTLSAIAGQFGTTVETLTRLNGLRNPNYIRVGQVLCLPGENAPAAPVTAFPRPAPATATPSPLTATPTEPPAALPSKVVIEATYAYTSVSSEKGWTLSPQAGVRLEYSLIASTDAITSLITPAQLLASVSADTPVLLWISRPANAPGYILSVVGREEVITEALHLQTPKEITALDDLRLQAGERNLQRLEDIKIWLESPTGERYPIPVAALGYFPTTGDAISGQTDVYLVLIAEKTGGYRLRAAINLNIFGPPNEGVLARCGRWQMSAGWIYRWLTAFYGCSRR